MNVFPDGNRNFGGAKWFGFCEKMFCPTEVFVAVVEFQHFKQTGY